METASIPNINPAAPPALKPFAVTIRKAQVLLGDKSRSEVYEAVAHGKLVALKDGGKTLITLSSIEAYMASLPRAEIKPSARRRRARRSA
jgi:hypothetical protein